MSKPNALHDYIIIVETLFSVHFTVEQRRRRGVMADRMRRLIVRTLTQQKMKTGRMSRRTVKGEVNSSEYCIHSQH